MSIYDTDRAVKETRKMMRIGITATFSGGIGLAIYALQKIFGGMAPDKNMNGMIDSVCLLLMAYTAAIIAVFIVRRAMLIKVNFVLLYIVMPLIVVKLAAAYM